MKTSVVALVALLFGFVAASAHAGTYDVRLCGGGDRDPAWTASVSSPSTLTAGGACTPAGGLFVRDTPGAGWTPSLATAEWRLAAPPGTSIQSLTLARTLAYANPWGAAVVAADGTVIDSCEPVFPRTRCDRDSTESAVTFANVRTNAVAFRIRCVHEVACQNGSDTSRASIMVQSGTARVDDPTPPTFGPLTGSVAEQAWHTGTETVTMYAADASGVQRLRLLAGDVELGSKDGACDFTRMRPCPSPLGATFSVDTSALPDGTHTLRAVATDAGGETATVNGSLRIDRTAPAAPKDVVVSRSDDGTFEARWTNPDEGTAAPIAAASYALCDGTACGAPQRVAGPSIERVAGIVAPAGRPTLKVWLEDEAGNADPGTAAVVPLDANPRLLETRPPILEDAAAPRIRLSSARRSGTRLIVKGSVANATAGKVTATVTRGTRSTRKSATVRKGKFTITVSLSSTLRRKGSVTLTVRHGSAKATKRLRFR